MFIPRLLLRFPPTLAGKRNWMRGFHRPSKTRFLMFRSVYVDVKCQPITLSSIPEAVDPAHSEPSPPSGPQRRVADAAAV